MTRVWGPVPPLSDLVGWKRRAADSRRSQGLAAHAGREAADVIAGILHERHDRIVKEQSSTQPRLRDETIGDAS